MSPFWYPGKSRSAKSSAWGGIQPANYTDVVWRVSVKPRLWISLFYVFCFQEQALYGPRHAKMCLWAYRTAKSLIRLRKCAVWSGPSLSTNRTIWFIECFNGVQMPGWYLAHARDNLNLHILHIFEGTFLLDAVHSVFVPIWRKRTFGYKYHH